MFLKVIERMKLFRDDAEVFVQAKDLRANGVPVAPEFKDLSLVSTTVGFLRKLAAKEAEALEKSEADSSQESA